MRCPGRARELRACSEGGSGLRLELVHEPDIKRSDLHEEDRKGLTARIELAR
jgi:hypothetical protein